MAQWVYLEFILQKCLLSRPLYFVWCLSKSLNFIGSQGDKRVNFRKKSNTNHLRNHKMDEAVTFHTCLWHYPLHKLCFCFGQVTTMVAKATFFIIVVIPDQ